MGLFRSNLYSLNHVYMDNGQSKGKAYWYTEKSNDSLAEERKAVV